MENINKDNMLWGDMGGYSIQSVCCDMYKTWDAFEMQVCINSEVMKWALSVSENKSKVKEIVISIWSWKKYDKYFQNKVSKVIKINLIN